MVYLCWSLLAPFLSILLWAAVLVLVFHPPHVWLLNKLKRPNLAAGCATLMVGAVLLLPTIALTTAVVGELQTTARGLQSQVSTLLSHPRLPEVMDYVYRITGSNEQEIRSAVTRGATALSQGLVQGTVSALGNALGFLVKLGFICFTMFYLFLDGEKFVKVLRDWLPLEPVEAQALLERCRDIISASVYGVVVIAIVQGCLGGFMFWVLGIHSPLLWTMVMILLSTIPMLGSFVVWVPAALWLAVSGSWGKAIALAVWGAVVIGGSDNLMRPRLVGSRTKMHDLLIFFAVLGGLSVFGMLGILMGPVIMAITITLLEAFRRADRRSSVEVRALGLPDEPADPRPEGECLGVLFDGEQPGQEVQVDPPQPGLPDDGSPADPGPELRQSDPG